MKKLIFILFCLLSFFPCKAGTIFVDADANGANDGSSWADAYTYLQDALAVATSGDEIWVAEGVYKPDQGGGKTSGDRTAAFQLINNTAIYGGFSGTEISRAQRDWVANQTILSGDIGVPDNNTDNSYHVVVGVTDGTLDGFTITGGNADGGGDYSSGGGMYNESSSPAVINCVFINNTAANSGGGIDNYQSNPNVTKCAFSDNTAGAGGGMYNDASNPIVADCMFNGNTAGSTGGGMHNWGNSNPILTNCAFSSNSAGFGGGVCNYESSLIATGCIFSGNSASIRGGGMQSSGPGSNPIVTNCTFSGNAAFIQGGGTYNQGASVVIITNSILWGNVPDQIRSSSSSSASVSYTDVQGGRIGTGNINVDPCFVEPGHWGDVNDPNIIVEPNDPNAMWVDGNYRLSRNSPCVDAGDNNSVPPDYADLDGDGDTVEPTPLELNSFPRFIDDLLTDDTGNGTPPIVDMGAYEFLRSDINGSGGVDFGDFALFASQWHKEGCGDCGGADLTGDGQVGWADLREFVKWWLAGTGD